MNGFRTGRHRRRQEVDAGTPRPEDFEARYVRGRPSWDIGGPQPAFLELAQAGAIRGRVLDVGCGTGEHALLAARLGLPATGVDISRTAIAIAVGKAHDQGLTVRFLLWDALNIAGLGEQFDTVLDSCLFHWLDRDDRPRYAEALRTVVPRGGRCFILCFSDRGRWRRSPGRGVTQAEIRTTFSAGWTIDAIDASVRARAWRVALTRI